MIEQKFIEVELSSKGRTLINLDKLVEIQDEGERTALYVEGGKYVNQYYINEKYDNFKRRLNP